MQRGKIYFAAECGLDLQPTSGFTPWRGVGTPDSKSEENNAYSPERADVGLRKPSRSHV